MIKNACVKICMLVSNLLAGIIISAYYTAQWTIGGNGTETVLLLWIWPYLSMGIMLHIMTGISEWVERESSDIDDRDMAIVVIFLWPVSLPIIWLVSVCYNRKINGEITSFQS